MSEKVPTKEQQDAIDCAGSMVAIAKPGSGKTLVVAKKIQNIVAGLEDYRGVIAISYTNKASEELKSRAASGVNVKASYFGTINKFCDTEITIPFLAHLWGRPGADVSIVKIKDLPEERQKAFHDIQKNQVTQGQIDSHESDLKSLFLDGKLILEMSGALALYTLARSGACQRYLRAKYTHIFIDEYQDSGLEQHQLFLAIKGLGLTAVAVGDADQSIYGFSNKDSKYLLSLPTEQGFETFPITFNHRCHPSIIRYSLAVASEGRTVVPYDGETMVLGKTCEGDASAIAKWISSAVPAAMGKYGIESQSQIGILVRSNATGKQVSESLTIKHRYSETHDLEEDSGLWSRLFCQLLRYKYDPTRTAQEVLDYADVEPEPDEGRKIRRLIQGLRKCQDHELHDSLVAAARAILPNAEKEEPVATLRRFTPEDLSCSFSPAEPDQVQLMTIHKSKGLEFDLVFHLDLYEWILPAKRSERGEKFFTAWEQDKNLHYVAITRAKKVCVLCTSTRRINSSLETKTGNPSEFLSLPNLQGLRRELKKS